MRTHLITLLTGALTLTTIAGCNKKDEASKRPELASATAPAATAPAAPEASAPAAAAKSEYTPSEFWAAQDGLDHMARMEKFTDDVTVNATLTKIVPQSDDAEYQVEADAGGGKILAIRFGDFGKVARARPLNVGDAITVSGCVPTNPEENVLVLVQCSLK
jgi:hypothetical protein